MVGRCPGHRADPARHHRRLDEGRRHPPQPAHRPGHQDRPGLDPALRGEAVQHLLQPRPPRLGGPRPRHRPRRRVHPPAEPGAGPGGHGGPGDRRPGRHPRGAGPAGDGRSRGRRQRPRIAGPDVAPGARRERHPAGRGRLRARLRDPDLRGARRRARDGFPHRQRAVRPAGARARADRHDRAHRERPVAGHPVRHPRRPAHRRPRRVHPVRQVRPRPDRRRTPGGPQAPHGRRRHPGHRQPPDLLREGRAARRLLRRRRLRRHLQPAVRTGHERRRPGTAGRTQPAAGQGPGPSRDRPRGAARDRAPGRHRLGTRHVAGHPLSGRHRDEAARRHQRPERLRQPPDDGSHHGRGAHRRPVQRPHHEHRAHPLAPPVGGLARDARLRPGRAEGAAAHRRGAGRRRARPDARSGHRRRLRQRGRGGGAPTGPATDPVGPADPVGQAR